MNVLEVNSLHFSQQHQDDDFLSRRPTKWKGRAVQLKGKENVSTLPQHKLCQAERPAIDEQNQFYPLIKNDLGRYQIQLDATVKKTKKVIYQFFRVISYQENRPATFVIKAGKIEVVNGYVKILNGKTETTMVIDYEVIHLD